MKHLQKANKNTSSLNACIILDAWAGSNFDTAMKSCSSRKDNCLKFNVLIGFTIHQYDSQNANRNIKLNKGG